MSDPRPGSLPTPDEVNPPAPPAQLSPSALDRFRQCPRRFFWQDMLRVAPEEEGLSEPLVKALAVHRVLDIFFSLRPNVRSAGVLSSILRAVWREFVPRGALPRQEERSLGQETEALLLRYHAGPFDMSVEPAARERWERVRLANGAVMRGRIDRLDHAVALQGDLPGLEVVDYKTGRMELAPEDLLSDSAMAFAAVAASRHRPVRALRHVYLVTEHEVRADVEAEDVEEMEKLLISLTSRVHEETDWPALPGEHCRFCPFAQAFLCPDAQRIELTDLPDAPDDLAF
jgi:putative RecB family exonuclease